MCWDVYAGAAVSLPVIETPRRLMISFSGGETSAYMLYWCKRNLFHLYDEVVVLFANTGQENEETLVFVDRCSKHFDVEVIWLEAIINPQKGKGTKHKIVSFDTADRAGNVFEDMIKVYGIPNQAYPHCTRELKLQPITSYCRSLGWKKGEHHIAMGMRVDEIDRMDYQAKDKGIIYPLITNAPTTKQMINEFWSAMPFRLGLKGYEGNCKWCWKKSLRKHFTLLSDHPEIYDFPARMEKEHGSAGRCRPEDPRVFFRNTTSTLQLIEMHKKSNGFARAQDDSLVSAQIDWIGHDLDISGDCSESCEVKF